MRFFGTDLKEVEAIFHGQRDKPVVGKNLPPCSGAVKWVRALHERVKDPMEKLTSLNKLVMETDESREVTELFERVGAQFEEYETEVLASWAKEVDATGEEKLKLNLLAYDEQAEIPGILRVNFDPKLVKLLRETKYFMLLDANVPASARKIYERNETLRQQTGNLDLIVGTFNNILRTCSPWSARWLRRKIEKIEEMLQKAITTLNWNSHKINDYLAEVMTAVKELDTISELPQELRGEDPERVEAVGGKPDDRSQRWENLRGGRVFRDATKTPGGARREDRGRRRGDYQVSPDVQQESRRPARVQSVARVRRVRQRNRHGGLCKRHPRVAQVPQRAGQLRKSSPRRNRRLYWKSASSSWCRTSSGHPRLAKAAIRIDRASAT